MLLLQRWRRAAATAAATAARCSGSSSSGNRGRSSPCLTAALAVRPQLQLLPTRRRAMGTTSTAASAEAAEAAAGAGARASGAGPTAASGAPAQPLASASSPGSSSPAAVGGIEAGAEIVERAVALLSQKLDLPSKKRRLATLTLVLEDEKSWQGDGQEKMMELVKEAARLKSQLEPLESLSLEARQLVEMATMAKDEGEEEVLSECRQRMGELGEQAGALRKQTLLVDGPADEGDAFLEIQAGAGGRESGDWVEMLLAMYNRWAAEKGFEVEPVQETWGEGGGLRSVMIKVSGPLAHGWCKSEAGVHRLVRISPFDANARRHTSFAQVRIYPAAASGADDEEEEPITPKDLRIDTYRSQGAGGQHVNTTDSAVRITHLPTGIVVTCQADRSQHRNKATGLAVLRAKLRQRREEEAEAERASVRQGLGDNAWGNQIRSYVLHPYQMVKDHRTGVEVGDAASVLGEGRLDLFIEAALASRAAAAGAPSEAD